MRVFVYFNLHSKLWSIKALEGQHKGRVIAHAEALCLYDVTTKVSEAGRQRVIREKRKNVHAGLVGQLAWVEGVTLRYSGAIPSKDLMADFIPFRDGFSLSYNPYNGPDFINRETLEPVKELRAAILGGRHVTGYPIIDDQPALLVWREIHDEVAPRQL